MEQMINVTIDGKECRAKEGEFILNVARANGIFIPAICYLTRCSPTLACRLCLVESDGKQIYACNAKAKDGMVISTTTPNIEQERRAIMEVYDVNHPLQCGVCDQSGECELQNYTLYMKVDKQNYATPDVPRPTSKWGVMSYDPGLCIVCEKCVTVCKDMIGSNALKTVKRGASELDKDYKASMPKDAYSMWNKLNKSLIGFEEDKCIDCGECISVCPVGALVSSDFKYKSNAWELTRIPAANPHSSDCSLMYYETKHQSIADHNKQIIYRVTNDSHYVSLSGAARFAYDFENRVESKDEVAFNKAIEAFKSFDTIKFNSYITNEEALILQNLKEKLGLKLVNEDAKAYQEFMKNYSSVTGKTLYSGDLKTIHNSNFVVSVGSYFKSDAPSVRYAFNNAITINKGAGLYFHPLNDTTVENFGKKGKTIETINYAPLKEAAVLYYILDKFGKDLPSEISSFLDSFKETKVKSVTETIKEKVVEIVKDEESGEEKEVTKMVPKKVTTEVQYSRTKLFDEIGVEDSFGEIVDAMLEKKDSFVLVVGEDLITHPDAKDLAKIVGMIDKYSDFDVVIIPTQTNTLGVSLICELDENVSGKVIGYNQKADFELSALGDGDLDMPALNQQEGTFVNIDKRLVPTNAALPYNGYTLNDIANELGFDAEYTIDYTSKLPVENGFKEVEFDNLANYFDNDWSEKRGYLITSKDAQTLDVTATFEKRELSGTIIYRANPINQFNEFTNKAHEINDEMALYVSSSYLAKLELSEGDLIEIGANNSIINLQVLVDKQLDGDIAYVPTFEKNSPTIGLFGKYRFQEATIKKA